MNILQELLVINLAILVLSLTLMFIAGAYWTGSVIGGNCGFHGVVCEISRALEGWL